MSGVPLALLGHATVRADDPARFAANRSSFYVDPVAWMVAAAAREAIACCKSPLAADNDDVGVLVLGGTSMLPTSSIIASGAGRGRVSPLRFAGANPGMLAGLICIQLGLRGPSLVVRSDLAHGLGTAQALLETWLHGGQADTVLLAACHREPVEYVVTCVVVREGSGSPDQSADIVDLLAARPLSSGLV
jgi:3-oxoacyl-(acyl-carrier-protein) synthase